MGGNVLVQPPTLISGGPDQKAALEETQVFISLSEEERPLASKGFAPGEGANGLYTARRLRKIPVALIPVGEANRHENGKLETTEAASALWHNDREHAEQLVAE